MRICVLQASDIREFQVSGEAISRAYRLHISKIEAGKLVKAGKARIVGHHMILMNCAAGSYGRKRNRLRCGQAAAYEAIGIEPHPRIFQGGLTRTETKPTAKPGILTWGHLDDHKRRPIKEQIG